MSSGVRRLAELERLNLSLPTASLYADAVGVVLLAAGRASRPSPVAIGPCLVAGALTAALVGQQLVDGAVTL